MKELYIIKSLKWSKGKNIQYWGPNQNGYTDMIAEAGVYTKEEADKIVRLSSNDVQPLLLTEALIKKGENQCKDKMNELDKDLIKESERYAEIASAIKNRKQKNLESQAALSKLRATLLEEEV